MNLKLLKYNITLALALSGIHYYRNPNDISVHQEIVKKASVILVQKINKPLIAVNNILTRTPASSKTVQKDTEPIPNDSKPIGPSEDSAAEAARYLREKEKFIDSMFKDKKKFNDMFGEEELDSDELGPIPENLKKINPVQPLEKPQPVSDNKIGSNVVVGGGISIKKESQSSIPSSGGSSIITLPITPAPTPTPTPTPTPCSPPDSPIGLSATIVNNEGYISWPVVNGADSYIVYRGTSSGNMSLLASGIAALDFTDTSMAGGTTYFYQISATNTCSDSLVNSNEESITSLGSFSLTSLSTTKDEVTVNWSNSAGATNYIIHYGTATGSYTSSISATAPHSLSLSGGQTYYFKVTAANSDGTLDSGEGTVYIPTEFIASFTFNDSVNYGASFGSELSSGVGKLIPSHLYS